MNMGVMQQFLSTMLEGDNYRNAQAVGAMLSNLNSFRRENIVGEFNGRCAPFSRVEKFSTNGVCFTGVKTNRFETELQLDIYVEQDCYEIAFHGRSFSGKETGVRKTLLFAMDRLDQYRCDGEIFWLKSAFKFPSQEKELFKYVIAFNEQLSKAIADYNQETHEQGLEV